MTVIRVSKAGSAYALVSYVFNVEIVYVFVNETGSIRTYSIGQLPTAGTSGAGLYLPFKGEYAQRNGVGCGCWQRLGEKIDARLAQVAQAV